MNLDELKDIWQAHHEARTTDALHSAAEIQRMRERRSRSARSRINRNIRGEMGFMVICLLAAGLMLVSGWSHNNELWLICMTISGGGLIFYGIKYGHLNQRASDPKDLHTSLREVVAVMGQYMNLYAVMTAVLVPLLGVGGVLYGYNLGAIEDGRSLSLLTHTEWSLLIGVAISYVVVAYPLTRWHVRRRYGVHYQELCDCLAELDQVEGQEDIYPPQSKD